MVQVLKTFCDVCFDQDLEVPSIRHIVTLDGAEKILDLCAEHEGPIKAVQALLEAQGRLPQEVLPPKPSKASKAVPDAPDGFRRGRRPESGRPLVCLLCELDYAGNQGLMKHYAKAHGVAAESLAEVYGTRCPIDGMNYPDGAAALAGHMRHHDELPEVRLVPQAFTWARENGDEHGVVATVLADLEKRRTDK